MDRDLAIDYADSTAKTSVWARLVSAAVWSAALPWRIAAIRRDITLMAGMSDRDLADIGLARQDIADANSLPIGMPPKELFSARVAERRQARDARRGGG